MPMVHRLWWGMDKNAQVVILDLQSKSTPRIASVCRDLGVRTFIMHPDDFAAYAMRRLPKAVILSGGPDSVYDDGALAIPYDLLMRLHDNHGTAILGICLGAQWLAHRAGGVVRKAAHPETGITTLSLVSWLSQLTLGGYRGGQVVMNHGDEIETLPEGWVNCGATPECRHACFGHKRILCTLFHPELEHTHDGAVLIAFFLFSLARCTQDHRRGAEAFVSDAETFIRSAVPEGGVVVGVSGGVDSAVVLELCRRALNKERVHGIHIDNGFLREGEINEIRDFLGEEGMVYHDASAVFYRNIEQIPWRRRSEEDYFADVRRIMGRTFVEEFECMAQWFPAADVLGQGTNWSDIQESETGFVAHHNVGGLPEHMRLHLLEPLASLYKDQIREVGAHLGLHPEIVWRQPSPGPANAIRMWPPVTREKASIAAIANRILEERIRLLYPDHSDRPSQYFAAVGPRARALVGDQTHYGHMILVRAVKSTTFVSAEPFWFSPDAWRDIDWHFRNAVPSGLVIARVLQDQTPKPSGAIEYW